MRLGEHVFDFITGIYIPLLNAHGFHCLLIRRQLLWGFTLTGIFHDFKAIFFLQRRFLAGSFFIAFSLVKKISHNIITAADYL